MKEYNTTYKCIKKIKPFDIGDIVVIFTLAPGRYMVATLPSEFPTILTIVDLNEWFKPIMDSEEPIYNNSKCNRCEHIDVILKDEPCISCIDNPQYTNSDRYEVDTNTNMCTCCTHSECEYDEFPCTRCNHNDCKIVESKYLSWKKEEYVCIHIPDRWRHRLVIGKIYAISYPSTIANITINQNVTITMTRAGVDKSFVKLIED